MKKSYDQTTKKLSLKISELIRDKLKIFDEDEYLAFDLSVEKIRPMKTGCSRTDWYKFVIRSIPNTYHDMNSWNFKITVYLHVEILKIKIHVVCMSKYSLVEFN